MKIEARLAIAIAVMGMGLGCGNGKSEHDAADGEDAQDGDAVDEQDAAVDGEDLTDASEDVGTEEGTDRISLGVGEVAVVEGVDGSFEIPLAAPGTGGDYVLILYSEAWNTSGVYDFTASMAGGGGGVGGGGGGAGGSDGGGGAPGEPAGTPEEIPPGFETWLDVGNHGPWVDWSLLLDYLNRHVTPAWDTWPSDPPPVADEIRNFQIQDAGGTIQTIEAQCEFVDDEIAVWFDITSTPATVIDNLAEIADLYRSTTLPRDRLFFGQESDLNGDGVLFLLFSPLVAETATAYFYPCDLIEDATPSVGCYYGNHAEMLYMSPPDMLPPYMASAASINETVAHETCHMIYFWRKFVMNDQELAFENVYITEGLAALAQDLTGMAGGNFFVMQAGLEEIETFRGADVIGAMGSYDPYRDGSLRGQIYLFERYLYDQNGGDVQNPDGSFTDAGGIAWLHTYVDEPEIGFANIQMRMDGQDVRDIMFDFLTALALSNRGPDSAPITDVATYNFLPTQIDPDTARVRGADMFGSFRDMFYLTGPAMATLGSNDGEVWSSGVQYLTFTASGIADLSVTVDPDAEARLRIARLQ